jgi:ribonuclease P protein component
VVRNRVKRWLREAARHALPRLDARSEARWDVVFIARAAAAEAGSQRIRELVEAAFESAAAAGARRTGGARP